MSENTKARVVSPDGETDLFDFLLLSCKAIHLPLPVCDCPLLREAIEGKEKELGFHLEKRKSRRVGQKVETDLDFTVDIALLSEEIDQAQELLLRVEKSVGKVALKMNVGKTKVMYFNNNKGGAIKTSDGRELEEVNNFKYLGACMESTKEDINSGRMDYGECYMP